MGALTSRSNAGVEEVDLPTNNAYRYPPKSGCYFGSHFIMGGERFDTTQPEAYLFGDNEDLNFLGNRPIPFPYPAPQAHEPTKTLKSLVNIRKDSVRFVKVPESETKPGEEAPTPGYNIEFTFDTDVRVAITVYYFATEEISNGQALYHPRDPSMNSETYHYKRGANQIFQQSTHILHPNNFPEEEWQFNPDKEVMPVVIQCVVEDEAEYNGHSHMTFAVVEKSTDGGFTLKPLKQKQMVDGLCYLLQEIYGIENKIYDRKLQDEDWDDNGSECVICMCDKRDTLILPCRHLCLCNCCADSLRYQANNCPICRAPFRALLQIRAMRKKVANAPPNTQNDFDENPVSQEGVPPGYEAVSLIEALNGPSSPSPPFTGTVNTAVEARLPGMVASMPTSPEESPIPPKRKSTKGKKSDAATTPVKEEAEDIGEKKGEQDKGVVEALEEGVEEASEAVTYENKEQEHGDSVKEEVATGEESKPCISPVDNDSGNLKTAVDADDTISSPETEERGIEAGDVPASKISPPTYEEALGQQDELTVSTPNAVAAVYEDTELDSLCLPGTPSNNDGSGSSYSSTSSTQILLLPQSSSLQETQNNEEKVVV